MQIYGVTEDATGYLLRWSKTAGAVTAGTGETYRTDVPFPCYYLYQSGAAQVTRWNGSSYGLVDQPDKPNPSAKFGDVEVDNLDTTPAGGIRSGTIQSDQDVEVTQSGKGMIEVSPNGTKYRIKVADDGTLSTEAC